MKRILLLSDTHSYLDDAMIKYIDQADEVWHAGDFGSIELAYKGTEYHGWQLQPNAISVQEVVNKCLCTILRSEINVVGAGRTDTGVHAKQLFAHFDSSEALDVALIKYKMNGILPDDIVVNSIKLTPDEAHARFDAVSRSYEYHIALRKDPFNKEMAWQLSNTTLNIVKMNEAAEILVTYSDFKSFSRSNSDVKTFECKISKAIWMKTEDGLVFYIRANRFLRNMVRAIVGTMVEIGKEKMDLEAFKKIIESRDRTNAGPSAPSQGLFLSSVSYPKSIGING